MVQDDLLNHLQNIHGENVQCSKCDFKGGLIFRKTPDGVIHFLKITGITN